jgi:ATP-dependent DNA ligase
MPLDDIEVLAPQLLPDKEAPVVTYCASGSCENSALAADRLKFLSPPITPMKARAVKSFPIGKEWIYEPKWDGFRCLIFRDEENIFLQSRTGKSLAGAFIAKRADAPYRPGG